MQTRTHKKSFPNKLDLSACRHVKAGETYEQAALQKIKEELEINCEVKMLKKVFNKEHDMRAPIKYFTGIFLAESNSTIKLNEKLTHFMKMPLQELKEKINKKPDLFCHFFISDFNEVKHLL